MAKKKSAEPRESTIENRVYLFKDLAAVFVGAHGALLTSANPAERERALRALADLAHASCVVADTEALSADEVAEQVAAGARSNEPRGSSGAGAGEPLAAEAATGRSKSPGKGAAGKTPDPEMRRGWGGGHGGG